jgi:hypothetical protein
MLASIRPDSWNIPLLVHVLGAMVLVGAAAAAVTLQLVPSPGEPARTRRLAFRTLLLAGVPAFVAMRAGAEWIHSKELGSAADDPTWVGIGYLTADLGGIVLLVSLVLSGVATRTQAGWLVRAAGLLGAVALAGWLVAVWAMGAKPA